ncbi:MAG: SLBB domain-containing protein [Syntrophorhabdus sp.]
MQPADMEHMRKNLSPEQQNSIQQENIKHGDTLTPDATNDRPEFKSLNSEAPAIPANNVSTLFYRMKNLKGYQDISTDLKPFGFEFFQEGGSKITAERQDVPVPGNYIVGPGDEVKILLWGRVNAQYNLIVDKDGNIAIPQIGPMPVAGMTFQQMSVNLIQQAEKIIGCSVNISMGSLKSISVFILGNVLNPGAYTVGSFATITDALLLAGGPSPIGSLRGIELKRRGKIVKKLDLYELFLKGDKSKDEMLRSGDVIFIPVTGPLVGIAGNVKRPAIYELKGRQNLQAIIELAGGILPTAYTNQIQVERVIRNERQVVIDLDDRRLGATKDFVLAEADLVKIFNIAEIREDAVYLAGNVKRPGKYAYRSNMRVKDLIKNIKDLEYETHLDYALIKRTAPPGSKSENQLIPFNLGKLLLENDTSENIELRPWDNIFIFSKWFFADKPSIVVEGAVRNAGKFDLVDNVTIKDAVFMSGGLSRDASMEDVEIYRIDPATSKRTIASLNLKKALDGDPEHNILLRNFDRITVKKINGVKEERSITVTGEVSHPGKYAVQRGERLSSVLERAGGYSANAYLKGAIFTRVRVKEMQQKAMEEMVKRLERELYSKAAIMDSATAEAKKDEIEQRKHFVELIKKAEPNGRMSIKLVDLQLLKGSAFDVEIENGDMLDIPTKNSIVNVTGAVMSQGSFIYLDDMEYNDYVDIAGGYTRFADKNNAFVLKADGTARRVNGGLLNGNNSRWELAALSEDKRKLDPGDTIIVPEKLDRVPWLKEFKDWTQILAQIAVTGGTINYMFK